MNLFLFGTSSHNKNDCVFQQSSLAEDMGLELVRKAQALKFQGGNTPSTLVPSTVPKTQLFYSYST